jgi:hypothetical protein
LVLLSLLGVALGAGGLRLTQASTADLKSYGLGAGIWTAVSMILSMLFGGYVAARLSGTHSHLDGELHGITVWALALLLATILLAQAASFAIGTVATGTGVAAGGAGSLTGSATPQISRQALIDRLQGSLTSSGDPTQMTRDQVASEITVLTGRRLLNGSFTDQERDRLNALVAAEAGVTREEAARRVARMEQDATTTLAQAEQQTRAAAETAASGAALGARALFSSVLLGLGAAMLGAWFGTRHARVLHPPHEPAYEVHPTASTTMHTAYEPAPTHTAVHVYDDTGPSRTPVGATTAARTTL